MGKRKQFPDINQLKDLCDIFDCDADYLLGRISQTTHAMEIACKTTGLSPEAISTLHQPAAKTAFDPFLKRKLPVFTRANELEEILLDYPEILHDVNTILTHKKKARKIDAPAQCLHLALKLYSYTQDNKKRFIIPNIEIYNFALTFIQQKLSYLENAANHFAKKSGEEGALFMASQALNQNNLNQ